MAVEPVKEKFKIGNEKKKMELYGRKHSTVASAFNFFVNAFLICYYRVYVT
jgi:hypothetical protein